MQISPTAKMVPITIQGMTFNVPAVFGAGHVLSQVEADVLNQTFHENLRNNYASKVEKAQEAAKKDGGAPVDPTALQAGLDEYIKTYEFGVKRGGVRVTDPVEREARDIAKARIEAALKGKGKKLKDIETESLNGMIDAALAKYPDIRAAAEKLVAARSKATKDIDLDDLGQPTGGEQAPDQAAA